MARILIVEDEIIVAMDIQLRLERMGHSVINIDLKGEDAIETAKKNPPDLILMDIKLSGNIDGIEAAEAINRNIDVPVVYLTAYSDDNTLERAKKTCPFGYIIKPLQKDDFRTTIDMALYKHNMERQLRQSEKWLSTVLHSINDGVITTDKNGCVTFINSIAASFIGRKSENTIGADIDSVVKVIDETTNTVIKNNLNIKMGPVTSRLAGERMLLISCDGRCMPIDYTIMPINDSRNCVLGFVFVLHDITKHRQIEMVMEKSRLELEMAVEKRTKELQEINQDLRSEILERKRMERELQLKSNALEETNTALKVLIKHREDDKRELEDKVLSNVKYLILPYVEKMKNSKLNYIQAVCLNVIETNLKDIISPFPRKMKFFNLTQKEMQIASLIKDGKSTKEIAELLNIAISSVDFHRHNIRSKLDLKNEKINLRSYLLNLD